jgi:hypothetical protein
MLPDLKIGDLLVVPGMGAYTKASATSFNGFQPPVTVLDTVESVPRRRQKRIAARPRRISSGSSARVSPRRLPPANPTPVPPLA